MVTRYGAPVKLAAVGGSELEPAKPDAPGPPLPSTAEPPQPLAANRVASQGSISRRRSASENSVARTLGGLCDDWRTI